MSRSLVESVASSSVTVEDPSSQVGVAPLFRAFDKVGRQLALQLVGTEGVGVGYDDVQVSWAAVRAVPVGSTVTVNAVVAAQRDRRHLVEYLATATVPAGFAGEVTSSEFLARAHGWTLTDPGGREPTTWSSQGGGTSAPAPSAESKVGR